MDGLCPAVSRASLSGDHELCSFGVGVQRPLPVGHNEQRAYDSAELKIARGVADGCSMGRAKAAPRR